jgi:hypothetical protein
VTREILEHKEQQALKVFRVPLELKVLKVLLDFLEKPSGQQTLLVFQQLLMLELIQQHLIIQHLLVLVTHFRVFMFRMEWLSMIIL